MFCTRQEARAAVDTETAARTSADTSINSRLDNLVASANIENLEKVLWTGTIGKLNDTFSLSDPVTDYDYIDVYVGTLIF